MSLDRGFDQQNKVVPQFVNAKMVQISTISLGVVGVISIVSGIINQLITEGDTTLNGIGMAFVPMFSRCYLLKLEQTKKVQPGFK